MPVELLIDGYNLMHNAGFGHKSSGPGAFERARDRLLKRLQNSLSETERAHTSIVFDAQYAEQTDRRPLNLYGMTILFSPRGRQADDLIEMILAAHSHPQQVLVISSDHRLQRAARHARAGYLSSDSFLVELDGRKQESSEDTDESSHSRCPNIPPEEQSPGAEELDCWLVEFRDVDVNALVREVQNESRSPAPDPPPADKFNVASGALPKASSPVSDTQNLTAFDAISDWTKDVVPLKRDPPKRRTAPPSGNLLKQQSTSDDSSGALPKESEACETISQTELNFWCERVEEMLREEDSRDAP